MAKKICILFFVVTIVFSNLNFSMPHFCCHELETNSCEDTEDACKDLCCYSDQEVIVNKADFVSVSETIPLVYYFNISNFSAFTQSIWDLEKVQNSSFYTYFKKKTKPPLSYQVMYCRFIFYG